MKLSPESISPWMDNLSYDWGILIENAAVERFRENVHIFHQGERAERVFIVLSGRVRLYMLSGDGREKAIVIAGKNCLIGENHLHENDTYLNNAVTVTDAEIASIAYSKFESIIFKETTLMRQYIDLINAKLRLITIYNLQLSYGSSVNRICDAFYHLAMTYGKKCDEGITIMIPFTHQELANLIGTSRVTVANTINELLRQNILKKKGKYYQIHNLKKLMNKTLT